MNQRPNAESGLLVSTRLSPETWHVRNHSVLYGWTPPMDQCRRCQRAFIRCRGKVSYGGAESAYTAERALNIERGWSPAVRAYACRYCTGWHLTSRMDRNQAKRAEKQRRKSLRSGS